MNLDNKDIEAIAKSRVNRAEGKKATYWLLGVMVLVAAGICVNAVSDYSIVGWILCIVGVIGFLYYQNGLSKKQNALKHRLLKEKQAEDLYKGETEKK